MGDLISGIYDGTTLDPSDGVVVTATPSSADGSGTYAVMNPNNRTKGSSGSPVAMSTCGATFSGYVTGGNGASFGESVLTVTSMTNGLIRPGQSLACSSTQLGLVIGTRILSQLSGKLGGVGTYAVRYYQSCGSSSGSPTSFASGSGLAKLTIYLVVKVPAATYSAKRTLMSDPTSSGGLDIELGEYNPGCPTFLAYGSYGLGTSSDVGVGALTPDGKTLLVLRCNASGLNMALSENGVREDPNVNAGGNTKGFKGGGTLAIGATNGADANPFTISEVVVADHTLLTTAEHQKVMGDLMRRHAIAASAGAIFGMTAPTT